MGRPAANHEAMRRFRCLIAVLAFLAIVPTSYASLGTVCAVWIAETDIGVGGGHGSEQLCDGPIPEGPHRLQLWWGDTTSARFTLLAEGSSRQAYLACDFIAGQRLELCRVGGTASPIVQYAADGRVLLSFAPVEPTTVRMEVSPYSTVGVPAHVRNGTVSLTFCTVSVCPTDW